MKSGVEDYVHPGHYRFMYQGIVGIDKFVSVNTLKRIIFFNKKPIKSLALLACYHANTAVGYSVIKQILLKTHLL